ncbi:MAG: PKD domain-containing protein [Myxococcota bacterium]
MIRVVALVGVLATTVGCGDNTAQTGGSGGGAGSSGTGGDGGSAGTGGGGASGAGGQSGAGGAAPSIAIADVSPEQCVGARLWVGFTLVGASGNLTLELSSPDGSFGESPVVIGSASGSPGSGTMVGFLPGDTMLGGMYRLRLVLNDGELVSEPTATSFNLNPNNPPDAEPAPDAFFHLVGDTVSFSANAPEATGFMWNFDNGTSSTDENPETTYSGTGTFNAELTARDALGCTTTESAQVVIVTCDATISSDAMVVTDTGSSIGGGGSFETWICDGGQIEAGGGGAYSAYVESGGEIEVGRGGRFVIHVKAGGTVTYGPGGAFAILTEPGATVVSGGGGLVEMFDCGTIDFDVSSAPEPGCP